MKIEEALPLLYKCVGIPFRRLFADLPEDLFIINFIAEAASDDSYIECLLTK